MHKGTSASVVLEDPSQIGEARRMAMSLAAGAGLDESTRSDVGIVVTEAATNVVKHAGQGEMLVRELDHPAAGIEVLCVDRGRGMSDVERCTLDGYSTAGTIGGGFGAMRRLADSFAIYSAPGAGTALVCRFWTRGGASRNGASPAIAGLAVPKPGEAACGDAWSAMAHPDGAALLMVDGLGHGPAAEAAADTAVRIFREQPPSQPERMLAVLHAGLRSTRGAAAATALIDRQRRVIRYAGIGNISAALVTGGDSRSLISHNGTVGHQVRKTQEFVYPWQSGALLILHSDGLATHWKLDRYPGLFRQDPAIVAGMLYRDHARRRDDVSVVVCRLSEAEAA